MHNNVECRLNVSCLYDFYTFKPFYYSCNLFLFILMGNNCSNSTQITKTYFNKIYFTEK